MNRLSTKGMREYWTNECKLFKSIVAMIIVDRKSIMSESLKGCWVLVLKCSSINVLVRFSGCNLRFRSLKDRNALPDMRTPFKRLNWTGTCNVRKIRGSSNTDSNLLGSKFNEDNYARFSREISWINFQEFLTLVEWRQHIWPEVS